MVAYGYNRVLLSFYLFFISITIVIKNDKVSPQHKLQIFEIQLKRNMNTLQSNQFTDQIRTLNEFQIKKQMHVPHVTICEEWRASEIFSIQERMF